VCGHVRRRSTMASAWLASTAAVVMTLGICQGHSSIVDFSILTSASRIPSAIAELLVGINKKLYPTLISRPRWGYNPVRCDYSGYGLRIGFRVGVMGFRVRARFWFVHGGGSTREEQEFPRLNRNAGSLFIG